MKKLTPKEAADRLGLPEVSGEKRLATWRCEGRGPAFLKIGGFVRYREEDLAAFEEASRFQSVAESKRAKAEAQDDTPRRRRGAA